MTRAALVALAVCASSVASAGVRRVDQATLEHLRTDGVTHVPAPAGDRDMKEIAVFVDVCIGRSGGVTRAKVVGSSGDDSYDAAVIHAIKTTWRFRPYRSHGRAAAVCAKILFETTMGGGDDVNEDAGGGDNTGAPKVRVIASQVLAKLRKSGSVTVRPDAATQAAIEKSGKSSVTVLIKICLDEHGAVSSATLLRTSGFSDYDEQARAAAQAWTFAPYTDPKSGAPAAACGAVTFTFHST